MNLALQNRHFIRFKRSKPVKMRLFCLPYAGGDGTVFRSWPELLDESIEAVGVEYPGRGRLFCEELVTDAGKLADILLDSIRPLLDLPFALYGHSNGAIIAYELSKRLSSVLLREPEMIFLAAKRSPGLGKEEPIHNLPTQEFVDVLRSYRGTPDVILNTPGLMDVYLPVLRADFALGETYCLGASAPIEAPCCLFAGAEDQVSKADEVAAWSPLFRRPPTFHTVPGGHFFMNTHPGEVVSIINRHCMPTRVQTKETYPC